MGQAIPLNASVVACRKSERDLGEEREWKSLVKNMPLRLVVSAAAEEVAEAFTATVVVVVPLVALVVALVAGCLIVVAIVAVIAIVAVVTIVSLVVVVGTLVVVGALVVVGVGVVVAIVVCSSVRGRSRISRCRLTSCRACIVCTVDQGLSCRGACTTASSTGRLVSLDCGLEVGLVDLNLLGDTIEGLGGFDITSGLVLHAASVVGLLNSEAATKRTGQGVVAASDGANVASGC